jgi:N5-(carboxyethyl)ornithine synthase
MREIGFVISHKENERRRALAPRHVSALGAPETLCFEAGYGDVLGCRDDDYVAAGARVASRETAWSREVVCAIKAPTPEEHGLLSEGQILFGWIHAVQNRDVTDLMLGKHMTGIAWEEMFDRGHYLFQRNRELTGEAGVIHALLCGGRLAVGLDAAVVGYGNVGRAAARTLQALGATVTAYDIDDEERFRREFPRFDIIVISVLWDVFRSDRLLYREDLARMKPGAMIVDLSCDHEMEVETSHPTTIEDPVYVVDGITHYAVDHVPALVWKSATDSIGEALLPSLDALSSRREDDDVILRAATVVRRGVIVDERISSYQGR